VVGGLVELLEAAIGHSSCPVVSHAARHVPGNTTGTTIRFHQRSAPSSGASGAPRVSAAVVRARLAGRRTETLGMLLRPAQGPGLRACGPSPCAQQAGQEAQEQAAQDRKGCLTGPAHPPRPPTLIDGQPGIPQGYDKSQAQRTFRNRWSSRCGMCRAAMTALEVSTAVRDRSAPLALFRILPPSTEPQERCRSCPHWTRRLGFHAASPRSWRRGVRNPYRAQ
jgi:hypothetical protein